MKNSAGQAFHYIYLGGALWPFNRAIETRIADQWAQNLSQAWSLSLSQVWSLTPRTRLTSSLCRRWSRIGSARWESLLTIVNIRGIIFDRFYDDPPDKDHLAAVLLHLLLPYHDDHDIDAQVADSFRVADDMGKLRCQLTYLNRFLSPLSPDGIVSCFHGHSPQQVCFIINDILFGHNLSWKAVSNHVHHWWANHCDFRPLFGWKGSYVICKVTMIVGLFENFSLVLQ